MPPTANAGVENVTLIVSGALANALPGINGAVPSTVPINVNVVAVVPEAPFLNLANPLTHVIADPATVNEPASPGVFVEEMVPLNPLTLTGPRGVSSVVIKNDTGIACEGLVTLTLRPFIPSVI
jgi:hypothetical protein